MHWDRQMHIFPLEALYKTFKATKRLYGIREVLKEGRLEAEREITS